LRSFNTDRFELETGYWYLQSRDKIRRYVENAVRRRQLSSSILTLKDESMGIEQD